jgi:hypothetical protein
MIGPKGQEDFVDQQDLVQAASCIRFFKLSETKRIGLQ